MANTCEKLATRLASAVNAHALSQSSVEYGARQLALLEIIRITIFWHTEVKHAITFCLPYIEFKIFSVLRQTTLPKS